MQNNYCIYTSRLYRKITQVFKALLLVSVSSYSINVYAFTCSIFEGTNKNIPSFKTEIAELRNMDKKGRHIKVIVPRQGPVQEFDLAQYIKGAKNNVQVIAKLERIANGSVVYIDLYPIEKRYEVRIGKLTLNLDQVIEPTVYANFAYNKQHNEVYDLQSKIAVFCN